jgi:hypothetical protein
MSSRPPGGTASSASAATNPVSLDPGAILAGAIAVDASARTEIGEGVEAIALSSAAALRERPVRPS